MTNRRAEEKGAGEALHQHCIKESRVSSLENVQPDETGTGQAMRRSIPESHPLATDCLSRALEPLWMMFSLVDVSPYDIRNMKHQQDITSDNSLGQPGTSAGPSTVSQIKPLHATSNVTPALLTVFFPSHCLLLQCRTSRASSWMPSKWCGMDF